MPLNFSQNWLDVNAELLLQANYSALC